MDAIQLQRQIASLLLCQSVFQAPLGQAFLTALEQKCLASEHDPTIQVLQSYGHWYQLLASQVLSWRHYIIQQLLYTQNPIADRMAGQSIDALTPGLKLALQRDLAILQQVAEKGPAILAQGMELDSALFFELHPLQSQIFNHPFRKNSDWSEAFLDVVNHYRHHGAGLLSQYPTLRWHNHQLVGIENSDPIRLHELAGYELQQDKLCRNTEALLNGLPALNVLLYGSRGAGKSALIKALIHEYSARGLRLIELTKADLIHLPQVVQQVRQAPQKFIFFVDDLSFEADEESYKALKVVLEGNVTARPQNVVVYATSNRRHLIREFFADRPRPSDADEIHTWDTVQEKLSLSDRFGLSLTFEPANQDLYLQIVFHLAALKQIPIDADDLRFRALQWATQQNGRSGRTAQQFITALQGELRQPTVQPEERSA